MINDTYSVIIWIMKSAVNFRKKRLLNYTCMQSNNTLKTGANGRKVKLSISTTRLHIEGGEV